MKTTHDMSLREKIEALAPGPYYKGRCVLWQGYCNNNGYGVVSHQGKRYLAHTVQAELFGMSKFGDNVITRSCLNKRCVNPRHLMLATRQKVINDRMVREGRSRKIKPYPAEDAFLDRCTICGKILSPKYKGLKYCSHRCLKIIRKIKDLSCKWCQKPREKPKNVRTASVYCSDECRLSYYRVRIEVYARKPYSIVHFKECVVCKGGFYSRARRKKRKTCGEKCHKILTTIRNRERALQRQK